MAPLRTAWLLLSLWLLYGCGEARLFEKLDPGSELIMLTRNSPTTYYFDGDQPTGFEFELMQKFADEKGLKLRVKVAFTLEELIQMLGGQEGHIAAAGLTMTPLRGEQFLASDAYITQQPLIVYKSGQQRPKSLDQLGDRDIVVLAGSSHIEALRTLQAKVANLSWREIRAADTLELMQLVAEEKAELAVVDSVEFQIQQQLYPRLVAALELNAREDMVWYLPDAPGASEFLIQINQFLKAMHDSGELAKLRDRHFGSLAFASRINTFTFQRKIKSTLPEWQPLIEQVAAEYPMDWRLLAAISYQESHWNPTAKSPTGVRGMMMITRVTAKELGIKDRTDPRQSLRGGARFLKDLLRRLPADIEEPDRTWMALAAYNIGMGHLEDARVLTEKAGLDPHIWQDVRAYLPQLQNPDVYPQTRYGFARGKEAVTYVDNIRHYYSALQLQSLPEHKLQPPVTTSGLLPESLSGYLPLVL